MSRYYFLQHVCNWMPDGYGLDLLSSGIVAGSISRTCVCVEKYILNENPSRGLAHKWSSTEKILSTLVMLQSGSVNSFHSPCGSMKNITTLLVSSVVLAPYDEQRSHLEMLHLCLDEHSRLQTITLQKRVSLSTDGHVDQDNCNMIMLTVVW